MEKQEVISFLNENGYVADIIDNIPFAYVRNEREGKKVKKLLDSVGYKHTFGWAVLVDGKEK